MCRLAFFPSGTRLKLEKLTNFLKALEKSFGGDGNGFAAISPTGGLTINKAVGLECDDMAKEMFDLLNLDWSVYFHTRKTSIGFTTDEQCHPFRIKGPAWQGSLCHNGTWRDGEILAKYWGVGSDTAAFAQLIGDIGLEEIEKRKLMPSSGVFLLYGAPPGQKPQHSVLKIGGSLEYCPETKIWASEFPKDWDYWKDTYSVKTGTMSLLKKPERGYATTTYNYNNRSNFGTTYNGYNSSYYNNGSNVQKRLCDSKQEDDLNDLWKSSNSFDASTDEQKLWGDRYWYHTRV